MTVEVYVKACLFASTPIKTSTATFQLQDSQFVEIAQKLKRLSFEEVRYKSLLSTSDSLAL